MLILQAIGSHVDISVVLFIRFDDGNAGAGHRLVLEFHLALLSVLSGLIHINGADLARRVFSWCLPLTAGDDCYDGQYYDDAAADCENSYEPLINVWFIRVISVEERALLLDVRCRLRGWGNWVDRINRRYNGARRVLTEKANR